MDNDARTLMRQCIGETCYCDWRLQIYGCVDTHGLKIIYLTMIVFSAIVSLFLFGIFMFRFFVKGHRLFDLNSSSLLKPRPIDCLMFFLTMFNLLRMLTGIILVTNVSQTNVLARTFMYEFPWQWGYGSCALYLLGIAQTLADSHKSTARQWLPSTRTVDTIGLTFLFTPFLLNNVCSIAAGLLAEHDLFKAEVFTRVLYGLWFWHCGSLACAVLYAGIRLLALLTAHLRKFKSSSSGGDQKRRVRAGMIKIRILVTVIFLALAGFAVFLLLYGILRDQIIRSVPGSYVLCIVWNFLGPVASLVACLAVLSNPRIDEKPAIGLPGSSGGGGGGGGGMTTTTTSTSNHITSHMFTTSTAQQDSYDLNHATLSAKAFDAIVDEDEKKKIHAMYTPYNHYLQDAKEIDDDEDEEEVYVGRPTPPAIPLRSSQSNLIPSPYKAAHF